MKARTAAAALVALTLLPPAAKPARAGEHPAEAAKTADAERPAEPARSADVARPGDATLAPFAAMRALQALQDQVARGSAAAQAAQPKMLTHVAEAFAGADAAAWKDPRNAGAAALFLFSGGPPSAVRAVVERASFTPEGDRLVKGALAYAEGQDDIARALLGKLDPKAMPAGLGGHLALVLASLFAETDPHRAEAMLDAARLLVPGTLVEEAALRRQIFLLADPASLDKFTSLSRQYIRRFRGSVFASNFKGRLTSFAVRVAVAGDVAQLGKLDAVFAELPQAERRGIYLTLARDALVGGRPDSARYAAARAAGMAPDPAEAERATLYAAAATAASDAAPGARATLAAIDARRLSPRDAELRDAALAVAGSVDADLGDRGGTLAPGGLTADAAPPPDSPTATLIARAHRALAAGDALLATPTAHGTAP